MKKFFLAVFLMAAIGATAYAVNNTVKFNTCVFSADDSVDQLLVSYDKYVTQYIATLKKAKDGDPKAMMEYAKLLKQAQDLQKKLEKVKGQMTQAQVTKLLNINKKLAKAAASM